MAARASKCFVRSAPGPCKYTSYPGVVCAMLRCCDMFAELPPPIAAEMPFNFSLARDAFLHQCGSAMRAIDLHIGQAKEDPLTCGSCGSQGRRHCKKSYAWLHRTPHRLGRYRHAVTHVAATRLPSIHVYRRTHRGHE